MENILELTIWIEILFNKNIEEEEIDLGSLRLVCDDRNYLLDVIQSYRTIDYIECDLAEDREELNDSNYNFTKEDLLSPNFKTLFFMAYDSDNLIVDEIQLHVKLSDTTELITNILIEE